MPIRAKAIVVIMSIVLAVSAATAASGYLSARDYFRETLQRSLSFSRDIADGLVSDKIAEIKGSADTGARHLSAAGPDADPGRRLAATLEYCPDFGGLAIYRRDGRIEAQEGPEEFRLRPDCPCLAGPLLETAFGGESVLSTTHHAPRGPGEPAGGLLMHLFQPLDRDRLLVATFSGLLLHDAVKHFRIGQAGGLLVFDGDGTVIAGTREDLVERQHNFIQAAATGDRDARSAGLLYGAMIADDQGMGTYELEGDLRLCAYRRVTGSRADWHVAVYLPLGISHEDSLRARLLWQAAAFLAAGAVLAFFLSRIVARPHDLLAASHREISGLARTVQEQNDRLQAAHGRVLLLLDSIPVACEMWDGQGRLVECNEAMTALFGCDSKQGYLEGHRRTCPEAQPDGQDSAALLERRMAQARAEGRCRFEFTHLLPTGEPLPMEITLTRLRLGGETVVTGCKRDLRDHQELMSRIGRRDLLLGTVNNTASILLEASFEDFDRSLHRCMGLIASAVGVDRMSIWKNRDVEGRLRAELSCQWLAGGGSLAGQKPGSELDYGSEAPHWLGIFQAGNCVHGLARQMAEPERGLLTGWGVRTAFAAPVFSRGNLWGFASFGDYRQERSFNESERSVMRSGGLLATYALLRHEMTQSLHESAGRLEKALEDAQAASEAKTSFLARMSHEMRTPLNAVLGLSELSLEVPGLPPETAANLDHIYNAGAMLLSTVNDILDISKIEAGRMELAPEEYAIPSLLNDALSQNVMRAGEKPVRFVLDIGHDLPSRLRGDNLRVRQILNNLLSNAFKHTEEGTVTLSVRCERDAGDPEVAWLSIQVRDTGPGISPEDQKRLFGEYYQATAPTGRKRVEGTGLGLSITRRLAEMMGGTIGVQSAPGEGSVFTVRVRQGFAGAGPIGQETADNLRNARYFASRRNRVSPQSCIRLPYAHVLVVDDHPTNLVVTRGILRPYGMQVDCVGSGPEAVEAIRARKVRYDAVFMDHMMPVMDGLEAARIIREEIGTEYARTVPLIALTANAIVGNETLFLSRGFQAFLPKPIDLARLDQIIRQWVRNRDEEAKYASDLLRQPEALRGATVPWTAEGVDLQAAFERFGRDPEQLLHVLRSYAAITPETLDTLEEARRNGDWPAYIISVHGLKGSSRGIGAGPLGDQAEELEGAARAEDYTKVAEGHPALVESARLLLATLEDLLRRAGQKPARGHPDPDALSRLRDACQAYDVDGIDAAMNEVEGWRYTSDGGLADWLRRMVDRMEYAQVAERLSGEAGGGAG